MSLVLSAACWRSPPWSCCIFMRDRPSDLGLPLYGETKLAPPPAAGAGWLSLLMSPINVLQGCGAGADLLGAVRDVFRLRLQHQWPDPDPFHHAVPRLRACGGDGGERAGDDGRFRLCRHHRLRLALRPLRSIAGCCSGITACADCRSSICRSPISPSMACRCSPCSTGSTGSPPCRRP